MGKPTKPLRIFMCHAAGDKAAAYKLTKLLREDGVDVWLDTDSILPGKKWDEEIPNAVRDSNVVVVCLSQQSIGREGYVNKEVNLALESIPDREQGEIFIIPARLDDCDVPAKLGKYVWVDIFQPGGYERLIRALQVRANKIGATLHLKKTRSKKVISSLSSEKLVLEKALNPKQEKSKEILTGIVNVGRDVSKSVILTGNRNVINFGNQVRSTLAEKTEQNTVKMTLQIHWMSTDELHDGKPYISIDITSNENRLIKCRCYIKSLELNGVSRNDIKRELVKHTNRVSWSGGSDEEVGIKHIDPMGFGRINLASLDSQDFTRLSLQFETAKGAQFKDKDGKFLPFGSYIIDLGLVCNADGVDFSEIPIKVGFEYVEEHSSHEDNVIKNGRVIHRILRLLETNPAKPVE